MRTVLVFERTITTLTTGTISFDFCTRMDTGVAIDTSGYSLISLGVGMYILDVPNAVSGTIFSISSTALAPQVFTQGYFTDSIDTASAVWNSKIHDYDDVGGSFGRKLRNVSEDVIWSGGITGATINTITLDVGASSINGAYDPAQISITDDGDSVGQTRMILQYDGATRTAVVDRNWKTLPTNTAIVTITAHAGREHVNEGLARGGTIDTITLNINSSDNSGSYVGQVIFIRSGSGEDQARRVIAYDGTTKIATVCDHWFNIPTITSAYVILPTSSMDHSYIAKSVYNRLTALHTTPDTFGEILGNIENGLTSSQETLLGNTYEEARRARALASNRVTIQRLGTGESSKDVITIFDDDNVTVLYEIEVWGEMATNRVKLYEKA